MTMIKLSDGCYIAADQISEVKINVYANGITVRTKDGIGHHHQPEYGEGAYAALDRLIAEIDAATKDCRLTELIGVVELIDAAKSVVEWDWDVILSQVEEVEAESIAAIKKLEIAVNNLTLVTKGETK